MMTERFEHVKDICDQRVCSLEFDLPSDIKHFTVDDVINVTEFRICPTDVFDHQVASMVCLLIYDP